MKVNTHPNYKTKVQVHCACGNTFSTGSVLSDIRVEICSQCHPFFTGQQKFVDTLGQVEKFQSKSKISEEKAAKRKAVEEARKAKVTVEKTDKPSLKDLLMQARKNLHS